MKCNQYLNPIDQNRRRITKAAKDFAKKIDFKGIKFPVIIRHIHRIGKRIPSTLVFLVMKIKKNSQSIYQKQIDLLLIGKEGKKHYVHIKDFNTFLIILYIEEENNFVVIVYKVLV